MAITDKIRLDFQVFSEGNPEILAVMDTSIWGAIVDKPSIVEITTPGSSKTRTYNFVKGKSNVFNSSNLLISPVGEYQDLVDGIYRISVKGSPDSNCVHRDYLKTDKAKLELYKIYASLGLGNSDEVTRNNKKVIQDIDLLIRASEALVSRGELKKGYSFFKKAIKDINKYNECQNCK